MAQQVNNTDQAAQTNARQPRKSQRPLYVESTFVTLIIDCDDQCTFFVHEPLLLKSKFFTACLKKGFREGETKVITLREDHSPAVECFINWLYSRELDHDAIDKQSLLIPNYQFGDKIGQEEYCDAIIDSVRKFCAENKSQPSMQPLLKIYQIGLGKSNLARFFLESNVADMLSDPAPIAGFERDVLQDCAQKPELMIDPMEEVLLYQKRSYEAPRGWEGCHFHDHKDGSACSARKE